ncbi:MAG: hypothetical protein KDK05_10825 [Candidatus Competibacteraceae bacterium]|nr:hypothetical protein [Candidatus Competibacteraceae bacterium]
MRALLLRAVSDFFIAIIVMPVVAPKIAPWPVQGHSRETAVLITAIAQAIDRGESLTLQVGTGAGIVEGIPLLAQSGNRFLPFRGLPLFCPGRLRLPLLAL